MELHKQLWKEVRSHHDKGRRVAHLSYKTAVFKKGGHFGKQIGITCEVLH